MRPGLIFVDVGTHEAQEFAGLFAHGRLTYLRRWLKARRQARRAGKAGPDVASFRAFLARIDMLRAQRRRVLYVMVEPNARLFAKAVYRKADLAFNIALTTEAENAALRPLFMAQNNPLGQGSSLFTEKPNVAPEDFDLVLSLDARHFAAALDGSVRALFSPDPLPVILRLNNEGAEVEVIRAFHDVFGARLRVVMGSLSDVIKVKGQAAHDDLMAYLGAAGIEFLPFHQNYMTWPAAADRVGRLLEG